MKVQKRTIKRTNFYCSKGHHFQRRNRFPKNTRKEPLYEKTYNKISKTVVKTVTQHALEATASLDSRDFLFAYKKNSFCFCSDSTSNRVSVKPPIKFLTKQSINIYLIFYYIRQLKRNKKIILKVKINFLNLLFWEKFLNYSKMI